MSKRSASKGTLAEGTLQQSLENKWKTKMGAMLGDAPHIAKLPRNSLKIRDHSEPQCAACYLAIPLPRLQHSASFKSPDNVLRWWWLTFIRFLGA